MRGAKKKKILIVDDEVFLVRALKDRLVLEGFSVISAADGEDGLKKAFADNPDLILLDLVMPKMDGITMLKKLRADERGARVSVVVLSNMSNAQSMDESLASGAQEFLVKVNNSLDDVARIARRVIGG
jgi:DNA-binding response OmpR family regulator